MDASRFDSLARAYASGNPRRDALRGLAGAGVSLAVLRTSTVKAETCMPYGSPCKTHEFPDDCCHPHVCGENTCVDCLEKGRCKMNKQCCSGRCKNRKCVETVKCEGNGCKKKKKKKKH